MTGDLTRLCSGARDLRLEGDQVEVRFAEGRHHVLTIEDAGDEYRVVGIVAKPSVITGIPGIALKVWRRNRATKLAGFRIDPRGRLLGESFIPKPGLTREEFQQWVRILATECDRFEYALTGKDLE